MTEDYQCPFCDENVILRQQVYETATERVLHNIRPATRGQCLVIPKRHVVRMGELSREEFEQLMGTVHDVSDQLIKYLQPVGMNYGWNDGIWAGQSVWHFHVHLMPRYHGDVLPQYHLFHRHPGSKQDL
ncbi:HIT domain-containing protein, partial [Candidatus Woesearchaeota archaeon]|nr:HIT domain-containing protein [Candidatus Woesearchaeota archaeon]